jgi:hypothetical protein
MAAPSKSTNYRSGAGVDMDSDAYFALLRAMKSLPKEANQRLRHEARDIAEDIVKPAVIHAIMSHAPTVGANLAQSVRTAGDRIPKVVIGKQRAPYYSGHAAGSAKRVMGPQTARQASRRPSTFKASTNMLRYGTIVGVYRRAVNSSDPSGRFRSRGEEVTWPKNVVRPGWPDSAQTKFYEPTFIAWQDAVRGIVLDWNKGVL